MEYFVAVIVLVCIVLLAIYPKIQVFILDSKEVTYTVEKVEKSLARPIHDIYSKKERKAIMSARLSLVGVVSEMRHYQGSDVTNLQSESVEWIHLRATKAAKTILALAGLHHKDLSHQKKSHIKKTWEIMYQLCENVDKLRDGKTIDATGVMSAAGDLVIAAYEVSA